MKEESLKRSEEINTMYGHEAARRRRWLHALFPGEHVIVVLANQKYLPYLRGWELSSREHREDPVLIFALDEPVQTWATQMNLTFITKETYGIGDVRACSCSKWVLFPLFADLLHCGKTVLFNDVDIVWVTNLFAQIRNMWKETSLISQLAPRWDAQGTMNSGIILLRPTGHLIVFVETLMSVIPLMMDGTDDQLVWNHMLRHHMFRTLTWQTIPRRHIIYGQESVTNETYARHFVGDKQHMPHA
jgi:hypothetical protein